MSSSFFHAVRCNPLFRCTLRLKALQSMRRTSCIVPGTDRLVGEFFIDAGNVRIFGNLAATLAESAPVANRMNQDVNSMRLQVFFAVGAVTALEVLEYQTQTLPFLRGKLKNVRYCGRCIAVVLVHTGMPR